MSINKIQTSKPKSPFAKYNGEIQLDKNKIDCYILDKVGEKTDVRVISMRGAVKGMTGVEHGNLSGYINVQALRPYIKSSILDEAIEFTIPGTPRNGFGISAETFLDICEAYVKALDDRALTTERQGEIAIKCSILLSACAKVGLIALIDEATGYQYEREEEALQIKLKAFIAEELRNWEKTFPDELWEEFGRLTNWRGSLHSRPKWWGKLVMELIYDALDPDVANYLRTNKPPPRHKQNYHQWFTADFGLKQLIPHIFQVIGIAKTCDNIKELREKVDEYYGKSPVQLKIKYPNT
ncbi:MAG: hypothetical protein EBE86_010595 [Hormoscilla sp. GUM202]|nr:hypothetical protein [Hormoscilla sp. GUM202]